MADESALSESFQNFISPINTGTNTGYRPGGDAINISYTAGKKSKDDELKELALAKAALDLEAQMAMPTDYQKQQFDWSARAEADSAASAKRAAESDALTMALKQADETRAQQTAAIQAQQAAYANQSAAYEQSQQGLKTAQAKQALAAAQQAQKLQGESAAREASSQKFALSKAQQEFADTHYGKSPDQYAAWYQDLARQSSQYNDWSQGRVGSAGDLQQAYTNMISNNYVDSPGGGGKVYQPQTYANTSQWNQGAHDRAVNQRYYEVRGIPTTVDSWGNVKPKASGQNYY